MDVINFSGGGPETDPANDAMIETVRNVAAAGVVPVISAGNDRDDFGLGTAGSPGTAPDAISVAAVSNNARLRAGARRRRRPARPPRCAASRSVPPARPGARAGGRATRRSSTSARSSARTGGPVDPQPLRPAGEPERRARARSRPARSHGAIALVAPRRLHVRLEGAAARGGGRDRDRLRRQPARRGERRAGPAAAPLRHDRRRSTARTCARTSRARGGRTPDPRSAGDEEHRRPAASGIDHELLLRGPDRLRPRPEAGRLRAGRPDPLRRRCRELRRPVRRLRRHEHGGAARRRRGRAPRPAASRLDAARRSSRRSSRRRGPAWADTAAHGRGAGAARRRRPRRRRRAPTTRASSPSPSSLSFGDLNVERAAARSDALLVRRHGRRRRRRDVDRSSSGRSRRARGASLEVPVAARRAAGRRGAAGGRGARAGRRGGRRQLRLRASCASGDVTRRIPYTSWSSRPGARERAGRAPLRRVPARRHVDRHVARRRVPLARPPRSARRADYVGPPMRQDGAEQLYVTRSASRSRTSAPRSSLASPGSLDRPVAARLAGRERRPGLRRHAGQRQPADASATAFDVGAAGASSRGRRRTTSPSTPAATSSRARSARGRYVLRSWVNDVLPAARRC